MGGKVLDYEAKRIRMSGVEEGRAETYAEGYAEGFKGEMLRNIRSVMESFSVTVDEAMIILEIPESDRPAFKKCYKCLQSVKYAGIDKA